MILEGDVSFRHDASMNVPSSSSSSTNSVGVEDAF